MLLEVFTRSQNGSPLTGWLPLRPCPHLPSVVPWQSCTRCPSDRMTGLNWDGSVHVLNCHMLSLSQHFTRSLLACLLQTISRYYHGTFLSTLETYIQMSRYHYLILKMYHGTFFLFLNACLYSLTKITMALLWIFGHILDVPWYSLKFLWVHC